jgi:hypothetical protein
MNERPDTPDRRTLDALTEGTIARRMDSSSLYLARATYQQGKVVHAAVQGATLSAQVKGISADADSPAAWGQAAGSPYSYKPCQVEVFAQDGEIYGTCSCAAYREPRWSKAPSHSQGDHYISAGWCEHIGAVLLAWVHDRPSFAASDRPAGQKTPGQRPQPAGSTLAAEPLAPGTSPALEPAFLACAETGDPAQRYTAEYQRMLSCRSADELQAIARMHGLDLPGDPSDVLAEELAAYLADPQVIRREMLGLDELGQAVLSYMHLVLPPGSGLRAETLVKVLAQAYEFGRWPMREVRAGRRTSGSLRRSIYNQVLGLCLRGLLLPLGQDDATYYAVPLAVRASLPPQPDLVAAYPEEKVQQLRVRETLPVDLLWSLYGVWDSIAARNMPEDRRGSGRREAAGPTGLLYRRADPPRQPIEDQWPPLQGWNHLPSEVQEIERQTGRTRQQRLSARSRSYSTLSSSTTTISGQSLTVPVPTYRLHSTDREFLCEQAGCTDPELEFYYVLLEEIGALSGKPGQPVTPHKEAMLRFLSLPLEAQMRTVSHTWQANVAWSEMEAILRAGAGGEPAGADVDDDRQPPLRLRRNLKHTSYKAADLYQEWRAARQTLLAFLSTLEEDRWVPLDAFMRAIFEIHPGLLHARSDPSVWWLESTRTRRQFGTTFDDWQQSYGRFVLAVLEGPLLWLGLVSLGYDEDRPVAFKLSPLGSFVIGRRAALPESLFRAAPRSKDEARQDPGAQATCTLGDDLTVTLVPNRVPPELHELLRTIGEVDRATPDRFVYRVTADGVRRWNEAVKTRSAATIQPAATAQPAAITQPAVETLIAELNGLCRQVSARAEIPDTWQDMLRAWSQNYGKLHVYEDLTLIELADDYVLQELLATTALQDYLVYQFSPRLVAIQPDAVDILVQEMEQRGYTPRVE